MLLFALGGGTSVAEDTRVRFGDKKVYQMQVGEFFQTTPDPFPEHYLIDVDSLYWTAGWLEPRRSFGTAHPTPAYRWLKVKSAPGTSITRRDYWFEGTPTSPGVYKFEYYTEEVNTPNPHTVCGEFTVIAYDASGIAAISPTQTRDVPAGGGAVSFSVTARGNWTATPSVAWITPPSASGNGNGQVAFQVDANPDLEPRSGTVVVGSFTHTVTQAGASDPTQISPASAGYPANGGSGSITVTSHPSVTWSATRTVNWITITAGASGSGNGSVSYTVAANTSSDDRPPGTIIVNDNTFTVNQAGTGKLLVTPLSMTFDETGNPGASSRVISPTPWTAALQEPVPWVHLNTTSGGAGTTDLSFRVDANGDGPSRTARIGVENAQDAKVIEIVQSGGTPGLERHVVHIGAPLRLFNDGEIWSRDRRSFGLVDLDSDGDLDIVCWVSPTRDPPPLIDAPPVPILLLRNDGGFNFTPANTLPTYNGALWDFRDADNDGDIDMLPRGPSHSVAVATENGYYRNDGQFQFTWIPLGRDAAMGWILAPPRDGFVDVLNRYWETSLYDRVSFRPNLGGGVFGEIEVGDREDAVELIDPTGPDFDGDGVIDEVETGGSGRVGFSYNGVYYPGADLNNDGVADLLYAYTANSDGLRSDGLKLFFGSRDTGYRVPKTDSYVEDSGADFSWIPSGEPGREAIYTGENPIVPRWGDLNGDGRIDFAVSTYGPDGETIVAYENQTATSNTPPPTPTGLRASPDGNGFRLWWEPVVDAETPEGSEVITYNVRVGSSPGAGDHLAGESHPVTGTRMIVAGGNAGQATTFELDAGFVAGQTYYVMVQAIDGNYVASPWSAPVPVTVNGDGAPRFQIVPVIWSNHPDDLGDEPGIWFSQTVESSHDIYATDPSGSPVRFEATGLPEWLTLEDHGNGWATLSGMPTPMPPLSEPYAFDIQIRALDAEGNYDWQNLVVGVNYYLQNRAAQVVIEPLRYATVGQPYESYMTLVDPDFEDEIRNITLADGAPEWLELTDLGGGRAVLRGTPTTEDLGGVHLRFPVQDIANEANGTFQLAVEETNQYVSHVHQLTVLDVGEYPPYFLPHTNSHYSSGLTYFERTFQVIDENPGDVVTITAEDLPDWLRLEDHGDGSATVFGHVPGSPLDQDHIPRYTLVATDSSGLLARTTSSISGGSGGYRIHQVTGSRWGTDHLIEGVWAHGDFLFVLSEDSDTPQTPYDDGSLYVYRRIPNRVGASDWQFHQRLDRPSPDVAEVSFDGDVMAIRGYFPDYETSVYRTDADGYWQIDSSSSTIARDYSHFSIDGDRLAKVVRKGQLSPEASSAVVLYEFRGEGIGWVEEARLEASVEASEYTPLFGDLYYRVQLDGDWLAVAFAGRDASGELRYGFQFFHHAADQSWELTQEVSTDRHNGLTFAMEDGLLAFGSWGDGIDDRAMWLRLDEWTKRWLPEPHTVDLRAPFGIEGGLAGEAFRSWANNDGSRTRRVFRTGGQFSERDTVVGYLDVHHEFSRLADLSDSGIVVVDNGRGGDTWDYWIHETTTLDAWLARAFTVEQPAGTRLSHLSEEIDYGSLSVNAGATSRVFQLTNTSTEPLQGITVRLRGSGASEFRVDTSLLPAELAPGASASFAVAFNPDVTGDHEAGVVVEADDKTINWFTFGVRGEGTPAASAFGVTTEDGALLGFGAALNLGASLVGGNGAGIDLTFTNITGETLDGLAFAVEGDGAAAFVVDAEGVPSMFAPGESATVSVGFDPGEAGHFFAVFRITGGDESANLYRLNLSALGLEAGVPGAIPILRTGVDQAGTPLPNGVFEQHYAVDSATPWRVGNPNPRWVSESPTARWISPNGGSSTELSGVYSLSTEFRLTAEQANEGVIAGTWAADNSAILFMNGVEIGLAADYSYRSDVLIDSGLVPGTNTLTIKVTNDRGSETNPVGVILDLQFYDRPPAGLPLAGVWLLDGNAFDSSGNGNNGVLVGGVQFSNDVPRNDGGQSLRLDGAGFVEVMQAESLNAPTAVTVAAWVKPIGALGWDGIVVRGPDDGSADNESGNFELRIADGTRELQFLHQQGAVNDTALHRGQNSVIPANVWTHVAVTADTASGDVIFYLDGEVSEVLSGAIGIGSLPTNGNPLYIGSRADLLTGFDGLLDEVVVATGALDQEAIAVLYSQGPVFMAPDHGGPVPAHRYSFSESEGTSVIDSIGSAHGVVRSGSTANYRFSGTALELDGGASDSAAYVDLPNGMISRFTDVTIEGWLSMDGIQSWARIFDFGVGTSGEIEGPGGSSDGRNTLFHSISIATDPGQQKIGLYDLDRDILSNVELSITPVATGQAIHFAVVYDADGNVSVDVSSPALVRVYRDGQQVGTFSSAVQLSEVEDVNCWIGRSNWTGNGNLQGTLDEFRIYPDALSDDEVEQSYDAGPDAVISLPDPPDVLADSVGEFSGVQGQDGWFYGYRDVDLATDSLATYDPVTGFTPFSGGAGGGAWDGTSQQWTGEKWELAAEVAPWTAVSAGSVQPHGINNGGVHWAIRRWAADGLAGATAVEVEWHGSHEGVSGGNGVTVGLYHNGGWVDAFVVAADDGVGHTETTALTLRPGDVLDLVVTPQGTDGEHTDDGDGTLSWMVVRERSGVDVYGEWARENGVPDDVEEAGSDRNGNGVDEILEYALGLPAASPTDGLPETVPPSLPGEPVCIQFVLPAEPRPGVTYTVVGSEAMGDEDWLIISTKTGSGPWSDPSVVKEAPLPDGRVIVTVESPWVPGVHWRGFLLLGVSIE